MIPVCGNNSNNNKKKLKLISACIAMQQQVKEYIYRK